MIPDRWSKGATVAVGAFSLSTTAVQVMELPLGIRGVIAGATLVSALVATGFYVQFKAYSNAVKWVEHRGFFAARSSSSDYIFRIASTEAAFAEVCRASTAVYGDDNPPEERTRKWWRKFPEGVFAAYWERQGKPPELAAYLSVWPLKKTAFERLRKGKMREADLSFRSIDGIDSQGLRHYWYISNIVVSKRHRRSEVLKLLIEYAANHWRDRGQLPQTVRVIALAYSREGENLLRRFGFHLLTEKSLEGWPVFELEADIPSISESISERLTK